MKKVIYLLVCASVAFAQASFEGIVYSKQQVELSFPIEGIISKILYQAGDKVKKDDQIIKIDDSLQSLEVLRRKVIFEDTSEYQSSKKNLEITKSVLDSNTLLYEKNSAVSKDELSNLQIQYQSLYGKVKGFEARKKQEEVEYKIAQEILKKYTIKSPINGVIKDLKYEEGEWAKSGEVAVIVVDTENCYVELNVDEPIARGIKINNKAKIYSNIDTIEKEGFVSYIAPLAESTSSLVKIRIKFVNTTPSITPGVIAKVVFEK